MRRSGSGVRRSLDEVLEHLKARGFQPATVIDVGVAYGTPGLYERFPHARLLLVEPLEEYRWRLEELRAERGAEFVVAAAGPAPSTMTLHVHPALVCSSTSGPRVGDDAAIQPREVPVVRLDDVCRERGLPGPHLLKVDVEGGELDVLDGARGILHDTEVVLLEVSLFSFNGDNPQFAEVIGRMRELGFVPYDFYGGHVRPLDGALAQLDVAFVEEAGRFRQEHTYATPDQAAEIYRSWGFASSATCSD